MPDTSTSWEDLILDKDHLKGHDQTDFTHVVADIPATDDVLIAAKGTLRRQIMAKCSKHASSFADREEFFDAIAALAATASDPLYEDVQDMLALAYLYHWHGARRVTDTDRHQVARDEALRDMKDAVMGFCPTLGLELLVDDKPLGSVTTRGGINALHSRTSF